MLISFLTPLRFFLSVLAFLALLAGMPGGAAALDVEGVRAGVHPDKKRLVIELDREADFRVFALSGPNRVVVDLPRFEWRAGRAEWPPQMGLQNYRYGQLSNRISRVVFDTGAPAKILSAFVLPAREGRPARLVVDYRDVSPAAFASGQKGRVLGTLTEDPERQRTAMKTPDVPNPAGRAKKLIVIDPGHGGVDPGAVAHGNIYEKDITFQMGKELKALLESSGRYRVHLTRNRDVFLRLHERVQIARKLEADLFLSIHADSVNKPEVRGASIYTLSEKSSDAQTARLAARENRADALAGVDLRHEQDDVASILIDLAMRDTMNQSKYFANTIVSAMDRQGIKLLNNPHRYAGFAVLKAPDIPSVLVEIGFISNHREARLLTRRDYRAGIARSLQQGIEQFFHRQAQLQRL